MNQLLATSETATRPEVPVQRSQLVRERAADGIDRSRPPVGSCLPARACRLAPAGSRLPARA